MNRNRPMKKTIIERFSKYVKIGTGAAVGAAVIAVSCRSFVPLKNSTGSDIVSSTFVTSADPVPERAQSGTDRDIGSALININTATSEELQTLSGIGEAKAAAIIEYRDAHGAFSDISEITNVSGIGEKMFESIHGSITVGEGNARDSAASRDSVSEDPININTASSEELQTLSGIGAAKAAAIIAYREEHGVFGDIGEITKVSGIGERIFEKIRGQITV